MTATVNEALLIRYIDEVWGDRGTPEAVSNFAPESYLRHGSPTAAPLDLEAQIERLRGIRRAFPDITIEVHDVVANDDLVAFRSTMRGTHQGEFLGIPASGRQVVVGLLDLFRVEDGRFMEQWGGPDLYDLAMQLGASVSA